MAGEADEALKAAGFSPCSGETPEEGDDDQDGSIRPPLRASARGGGDQTLRLRLRPDVVPLSLWSCDKDTDSASGFLCCLDLSRSIMFAELDSIVGEGSYQECGAIKAAITALLDTAEACNAQKILLGLCDEYAGCAELVCELLYLGFQVVPTRKTPLVNAVLLLELEMGLPVLFAGPGIQHHSNSDNTCTGTSECSTSAEDTGGDHVPDSD